MHIDILISAAIYIFCGWLTSVIIAFPHGESAEIHEMMLGAILWPLAWFMFSAGLVGLALRKVFK